MTIKFYTSVSWLIVFVVAIKYLEISAFKLVHEVNNMIDIRLYVYIFAV